MEYKIVFLQQAVTDLKALKKYIVKHFSQNTWKLSYEKIKNSVGALKTFPQAGHIPPELESLGMDQYRQIISGMNRIIYEIRQNTIYIHVVSDVRRDMKSVLTTKLLRIVKE